jgi:transposase
VQSNADRTGQQQFCHEGRVDVRLLKEVVFALLAAAKPTATSQRLVSLPGIGPILGMTIALETGPMARFASAGDYASYCRTVNSRRESASKKKGENNRKNGNKYLAWAYVEAAHFAQRYSPRAHARFASKTARVGRVVAVKALAGKLAKAAFYVLRDEVDFDKDKLFGSVTGGDRQPEPSLVQNRSV